MRVGFVVPRYGTEVVGGAELAARLLAEHVAGRPGWSSEVFTTCAQDAATWCDVYEPGTGDVNGVTVHRFRSRAGRGLDFAAARTAALRDPSRASETVAMRFIEQLGPVCPDAVDAAVASECAIVALGPYMYHPIVSGVARLGRRAVLHGAAHDEPEIRLAPYRDVFERAGALVHWSAPEQQLVASLFPNVITKRQLVLGLGVDVPSASASDRASDEQIASARKSLGIGEGPYLLCLGRTLEAKGTTMLARFFRASTARSRHSLRLVFAGPVVDAPPTSPDVIIAGAVDDATKWALLRGAVALVSPSPYESLGIVLLEAWSVRTPALVNGACAVTVDQCTRAGGGLWFDSLATFDAALDRLAGDTQLRERLAQAGREYVEEHYTWPMVTDRYTRFLERTAHAITPDEG